MVEDHRPGAGVEVSSAIGAALVLYGEVFSQRRLSLAAQGLPMGTSSAFRDRMAANGSAERRHQAAVGGIWSLPESWVGHRDISLVLEYHYNGAGLSVAALKELALASGRNRLAGGRLRRFATDRQEPLSRGQVFTRLSWNNVWKDADLALIGFFAPQDGGGLAQLSAGFPLNPSSEVSLRVSRTFGASTSVYGALPTQTSVQIAFRHSF